MLVVGVALGSGACGGSSKATKKTAASQPTSKKGAADTKAASSQPAAADASPSDDSAATDSDDKDTTPAPDAHAAVRPPTQDLPPERRDAMVKVSLRRARQSLDTRDGDNAIRASLAALDLDEANVEAMVDLANGYYLKQYDDKAEAVLRIAEKQKAGKSNPVLYMLLGLVYDRADGKEDQALAAYERAAQLKPDYVAAETNRGSIYLKRKRYRDAVDVFTNLVRLQAQSARLHADLGCALRGRSADTTDVPTRARLIQQAATELQKAMTLDAKYAPAYFDMGILYLDADPYPGLDSLGRYQQAAKFLSDYKRVAGPAEAKIGGVSTVDEYLIAAQKGIDREQKLLDRKKKRDAEKGAQPDKPDKPDKKKGGT